MGYKNLVAQACAAGKEEMFCNIRDFLCALNGTYNDYSSSGIGWSLHDSSYAVDADNPEGGDWFVITSDGEDGTGNKKTFIKFDFNDSAGYDYIYINNGTGWDTSENDFVNKNTQANFTTSDTLTGSLYIYGGLDFISILFSIDAGAPQAFFSGYTGTPRYDVARVSVTSGAITSGNNVTFTVASVPSSWAVGKRICVFHTSSFGSGQTVAKTLRRPKITVISGSDITVDTIYDNIASGAVAVQDVTAVNGRLSYLYAMSLHNNYSSPQTVTASNRNSIHNSDDTLDGVAGLSKMYLATYNTDFGCIGDQLLISLAVVDGVSSGDVLQVDGGTDQYRYLYVTSSSNYHLYFKEV